LLLLQHLQQRQAMQTPQERQIPRSSCSSGLAALRCSSQQSAATEFSPLLSKQPTLGRSSTKRMQRHVLQVADQLKGLAIGWQQRLDDCQPLSTSPTYPGMITISAAAAAAAAAKAAAAGGRGTSSTTQVHSEAPVPAASCSPGVAGAAAKSRPAGCSEAWGSISCNSSSTTAMCTYDASCDLSSSTSSFVRYRSSQQPPYGESPADIAEGDEDDDEEATEQQHREEGDGYVCCETDEEEDEAQLRWHVQQLEQQQQPQQRQLPSHSQLQQHAQQQVLAKHAQWHQQQQQQAGLRGWNRPALGSVALGCAITRGAAARGPATAATSSSTATLQRTPAAREAVGSVVQSPPAAAATGGKSLPPAPRVVPQQQSQQQNTHSYNPACDSWQQTPQQQQQQQQQHSSPFPSLSGTSYSGTPVVQQQQQHSLCSAGTGVEHIPQELKFMAPLRRHQQYLGTT
jgi:hypothetical protein